MATCACFWAGTATATAVACMVGYKALAWASTARWWRCRVAFCRMVYALCCTLQTNDMPHGNPIRFMRERGGQPWLEALHGRSPPTQNFCLWHRESMDGPIMAGVSIQDESRFRTNDGKKRLHDENGEPNKIGENQYTDGKSILSCHGSKQSSVMSCYPGFFCLSKKGFEKTQENTDQ